MGYRALLADFSFCPVPHLGACSQATGYEIDLPWDRRIKLSFLFRLGKHVSTSTRKEMSAGRWVSQRQRGGGDHSAGFRFSGVDIGEK